MSKRLLAVSSAAPPAGLMGWTRDRGSFRDPSGFIFRHDGDLYRQVNASFGPQFRRLIETGLYDELASHRLLVPHEEVDVRLADAPPAATVLKPQLIDFISYPYEWCFGELKAAALLTLEVQRRALSHGMVLRDASAFNVQFEGVRPVFIDTLSFGDYTEGEPWAPYRQFCEHFLAPLALVALVDPSLGQLTRIHLDGIPLRLASRLLPLRTRFSGGLLTHIHLHAKSLIVGPEQHQHRGGRTRARQMSKTAMLGLIDSLKRTVNGLSWTPPETLWSTYTDHSNYSEGAHTDKQALVARYLEGIGSRGPIRTIWDFGANTGTYSALAAKTGASVVSFDVDHASVESHYRACVARKDSRVLPLLLDLTNPSAAIGWHHQERHSLEERGPADVVMALAVVHHLAIGNNVPFADIARFFASMCRWLIVEFVPKEDSQLRRMLELRPNMFDHYTSAAFEDACGAFFRVAESVLISESGRSLYLMERR
jgi:hypothetical protein